ncbi:MAG: hypothetical protein F6K54_20870 [Okeania sp. SIO3B5]|uniref:hypothetical protein n=1 Tax=Okeania sp. SIO3B5 TaxID=2607811 RepID=UPI0013FF9393|nr:hypothetical protein [Okeania sp. SIO3B5]NEO55306.1 hypothetical protein [Okeania sp. SIO3B5]
MVVAIWFINLKSAVTDLYELKEEASDPNFSVKLGIILSELKDFALVLTCGELGVLVV